MEMPGAKDNLTYSIGDVKFFIRAQATVEDKFELDMQGDWKDGKFEMSQSKFYRKLVERFVTGWDGVTQAGKPVPYTFERLLNLPADATADWLIKIGTFVASNTGIFSVSDEPPKNG